MNPMAGERIPGTGGVRKLRFALAGRGKRGGARVIYYYWDESEPLYALLVYPKTAKADLSQGDRRAVAALVRALKTALKEEK